MIDITENMKKALRGELTATEFVDEGMNLFRAGLVSLDPLSKGPTVFVLTNEGRRLALELREKL